MATSPPHEATTVEPAVRTITHIVPNLRNRAVAEEYKRQSELILAASSRQSQEMKFWEAAQSHEGWV